MGSLTDSINEHSSRGLSLKGECIYITKDLKDMQECAAKDRHGLVGVKITTNGTGERQIKSMKPGEAFAWATQGSVLVIRPLGYKYDGGDVNLTFSGPSPTKDEWFDIPAELGDHVCDLKNGKKLVVTVSKADGWPDIHSVVNGAIESTKAHTVGMDTRLLKAVLKGLSESSVILRVSKDPLDPMIVQPTKDEKSLIVDITTGGVNGEFSIAMPLRVD